MLVVSQGVALVLLAVAVVVSGEPAPPPAALALAGAPARAWPAWPGLAALYRGLAVGAMAVVAPIAALGRGASRWRVGIATGDRPGRARRRRGSWWRWPAWRWPPARSRPRAAAPAWRLARGWPWRAALGIGLFLVGMDAASDDGVLWALFCARVVSVALLRGRRAGDPRPTCAPRGRTSARSRAIGVLDLAANGLFALAATEGLVSVASVCSSLYPVVTIILARAVLPSGCARRSRSGWRW